jgi:hypothetical protein
MSVLVVVVPRAEKDGDAQIEQAGKDGGDATVHKHGAT